MSGPAVRGGWQEYATSGEKGRILGAAHFCWSSGMYSGTLVAGRLVERSAGLAFSAGAAAAVLAAITATALYLQLATAAVSPGKG